MDIIYTALNNVSHEDPWLRLTTTLSKVAHGLYLYADHVVWLARNGFLRSDSDKWNITANKFWLVSIIANLAKDFYEILHILQISKTTFVKPSELLCNSAKSCDFFTCLRHVYLVVNCHRDIFLDTLKDSCDLFIPLTTLGFVKFTPSTIGVLGAVSSMAALFTIVKNVCDAREKL